MKKTFIKGLVVAATMALAMSFSSLVVSAEELDMTTAPGGTSGIFTVGASVAADSSKTYTVDGVERTNTGLKLSSNLENGIANGIAFTVTGPAELKVVALGGGSGTRGLNLYKDVDGTATKIAESFLVTPDNATFVQASYDITEAGTYYIGRLSGKTMRVYYVDVTATTGTVYDESSFGDATTDFTATVPGDVASDSVSTADVIADVTQGAEFNDKTALGADKAYGNVTFGSGLLMYNDTTLRTGGSTSSSNGRYVMVTANAGDVIVLEGCRSQNATDTSRYAYLSATAAGSELAKASAPLEENNVSLTAETAGTYYVCFSNGIQFKGVSVYSGVEVTTPAITLAQTTVADTTKVAFKDSSSTGTYSMSTIADTTKVAFKGVISGNADARTPVTAINVVTAKGFDASAASIAAKTHAITAVAPDGSDYAFIVTIDKSDVDALPGLKIQASVDYDNNGNTVTNYSDVVTYTAG